MSSNPFHRPIAVFTVALGLLMTLTACSDDTSNGGSSAPSTARPATAVPSTGDTSGPATRSPATQSPGTPGSPAPAATTPGSALTPTTSYAQLVDMWRTGGTTFAVTYDRVDFLTGAAAKAYYRKHPGQEPHDWAVSNENHLLRQLPAAATATFYGNQLFGSGHGAVTTEITGDHLIAQLKVHPRALVKISERPRGTHREVVKITEVFMP